MFISHAQNFEDLMLWRALSDVTRGFYIDAGAGDPDTNTVTRAFYERGWNGVNIEPDPTPFAALVRQRERDTNLPIALADSPGERRFYIPSVAGLATLDSGIAFQHRARGMTVRRVRVPVQTLALVCRQYAPTDVHFLNIDVEGAEALVLQGADFAMFRPWIVVVKATLPLTRQETHSEWEPLLLAAGYRFVWFDAMNRFYVAGEHHDRLAGHFRVPPNCFDGFRLADPEKDALSAELREVRAALEAAQAQLRHQDAMRLAYARATELLGQQDYQAALAGFDQALEAAQATAELLNDRAIALIALGRCADALESLDRALAIKPDYPHACNNRGFVLCSLDRDEDALASFDRAVALRPDYHEAWNNRATALRRIGNLQEALASCDAALSFKPDYPSAWNNRGSVLQMLERLPEARECFEQAIALAPDFLDAYVSRAGHFQALLQHDDALKDVDHVLALQPNHAAAHWTAAASALASGDFDRGWQEYEWRWLAAFSGQVPRVLPEPLWLGDDDLAGKTILLYAEQGFGDIIQFCRYVPLVAERCRVVLEVPGELVRLLCTMDQGGDIFGSGAELPPFDVRCPLGSLPRAFRTTLATIPAAVPYLRAAPAAAEAWRQRLAALPGLHVGLVWSGRIKPFERSIPANELSPLGRVPGVSLISLQMQDPERPPLVPPDGVALHDWTAELHDFADTAALVAALDLVISIDTAVAHLAGALGKPVWLMNRFNGCWRWLLDRADSPWYPSMRLFRQSAPNDWAGVVDGVAAALAELAARHVVSPSP